MTSIYDTQNALAQHFLHLTHEAADLGHQLGLDIILKPAVGLRLELRIEGVAAEDLLKRALQFVGEQLEQLLLDATEHLAELKAKFPVDFS